MIRLYLWFCRVHFFLHADHGCGGHPAFPAPSVRKRDIAMHAPDAIHAAGTRAFAALLRETNATKTIIESLDCFAVARNDAGESCLKIESENPVARSAPMSYFVAEKRLSNEFVCTIGWAPATRPSLGAAAGSASEAAGLNGGRLAACLVSAGFAAATFGVAGLASAAFGLAGAGGGGVVDVVSGALPRPILRARLENRPSDCAFGAADATRVVGAGAAAGAGAATAAGAAAAATAASSEPGMRGGLTVEGIV